MLFNIFLSSLLPLRHKLLQNPNLNYLFRTLNLTHTLLNASNTQLAKDCWICLSITPLGDSALPISILDWTLVTYPYNTHIVGSLYSSHILNIFTQVIKSGIRTKS